MLQDYLNDSDTESEDELFVIDNKLNLETKVKPIIIYIIYTTSSLVRFLIVMYVFLISFLDCSYGCASSYSSPSEARSQP